MEWRVTAVAHGDEDPSVPTVHSEAEERRTQRHDTMQCNAMNEQLYTLGAIYKPGVGQVCVSGGGG